MEHSDQAVSTRDLASGDRPQEGIAHSETDAPSREAVGAEPATADSQDDARQPDPLAEPDPLADPLARRRPAGGDGAADEYEDSARSAEAPAQPDGRRAEDQPVSASSPRAVTADDSDADAGLLSRDVGVKFQTRWEAVQTRFVDEPRGAVEDADELVAAVMKHLAEQFAREREQLEAQWGRGEDISTEDLRVALQRYRSFFNRLLSA